MASFNFSSAQGPCVKTESNSFFFFFFFFFMMAFGVVPFLLRR